jgi:hypothetical protein
MMVRVLLTRWQGWRRLRLSKAGEVEAYGAKEPRKWCRKRSVRVAATDSGDSVPCVWEGGNSGETTVQEHVKRKNTDQYNNLSH